ncbi:sensor domain-containing phosphodiesterase [Acidocella sp.]|jgi:EAL domain-containing protein (putative c-di-GMP-specific phosphodiesterase class I)|uniref:sensor domain-containing phosphodiesterase n=1 Tax=Acidocella sp. TaxID=50710 RepID=UPI002F4229D7
MKSISSAPDAALAFVELASDLDALLRAAREHLGMEAAFISKFAEGQRVVIHADAAGPSPIAVGTSDPLEETYCQRVVDGRLPELIPDTALVPAAMTVPVNSRMPVGAHLSLPIRLADGSVYGTFCCLSRAADPTLNMRDLQVMRFFADLATQRIERTLAAQRAHDVKTEAIRGVLEGERLGIVFQPIHDLQKNRIVGVECLARFLGPPQQGPDIWFADANEVGLGSMLESAAMSRALRALDVLPADIDLNINVSPATVLDGTAEAALNGWDPHRIVLEVTEHVAIDDYAAFVAAITPLRARGIRLAVDDAGAGYASFRHILQIRPDTIKLDISLTRGIDANPDHRALAAALIGFAHETGSTIVAEGVETVSELDQLRKLGAHTAQGYLLGRPMGLPDLLSLLQKAAAF